VEKSLHWGIPYFKRNKDPDPRVSIHLIFCYQHAVALPRPSQRHTLPQFFANNKHQKARLIIPNQKYSARISLILLHISLGAVELHSHLLITWANANLEYFLRWLTRKRRSQMHWFWNISYNSWKLWSSRCEITHH
jgi:hypothetical protein